MENNKIFRTANRLSTLTIIIGVLDILSIFGSAVLMSLFAKLPVLILAMAINLLIAIFLIRAGTKIKKNKTNLSAVRGYIKFVLIVSITVLITAISQIGQMFSHHGIPLPGFVLLILGIILVSDSSKLLKASKTQVSQPNI